MERGASLQVELTDEELALRFKRTQDDAYFTTLFTRHKKKVFFLCCNFFGEASRGEDATQEAFLRAYQNIAQFQGGDFVKWLMRIAKNVCIDEWRKLRPVDEFDESAMFLAAGTNTFESSVEHRAAVEEIYREMTGLPREQQLCLRLKIEGYSYEETARRTGYSIEAVKSYLQNGRRMLWLKVGNTVAQLR